VTRDFLHQSGTTAGYDPSFMAGYAKSVVFPASSTLPEVVVALFGRARPVLAYKLYVLAAVAAAPWLIAVAARAWGLSGGSALAAVALWLVYLWTDFPIQYATYGMVPYFLAVPLGLLTTGAIVTYLDRGGAVRWAAAAVGSSLVALVHFTLAMVVAPAALVGLVARACRRPALSAGQYSGFFLIPLVVLAVNAFWWWPGVWLASTKGPSDFAFAHPEGVFTRLLQIVRTEPAIEAVLWVLGTAGLAAMVGRRRPGGAGLVGFAAAGFFWGYGAGAFRSLDFLQPGRHTFALYTALALAGGEALGVSLAGLGSVSVWLRRGVALGVIVVGLGAFGRPLAESIALRLGDPLPWLTRRVSPSLAIGLRLRPVEPFLSSRPGRALRWVIDRVRRHVRPGERLLYEEGGFAVPGLAEPFGEGRYSGLIPFFAPGVELLGGPYLHAALATNFTQFGEGKLFGRAAWGREDFTRFARLYRPSAIVCWSPHARAFCRSNPDLVEILDDEGRLLIGRVKGFEGATIEGAATVEAHPGRLVVRFPGPPKTDTAVGSGGGGELDGRVVLRYHFVPHLRSRPASGLEPVPIEGDPVPFIGLRPTVGGTVLELRVPPFGGP
jgi:hypothetical protein